MKGHALEIVKPGRGSWFAQCRCGVRYPAPARGGGWIPSEVSEARIRELHRAHKAELAAGRKA